MGAVKHLRTLRAPSGTLVAQAKPKRLAMFLSFQTYLFMIKKSERVMVCDGICGESANGFKIVAGISYSFYVIFSPFLSPIPNFI